MYMLLVFYFLEKGFYFNKNKFDNFLILGYFLLRMLEVCNKIVIDIDENK